MRKQAAFFGNSEGTINNVYGTGRREHISELTDLYPAVVDADGFADVAGGLAGLEVIFSTWGMFPLTNEQFAQLPNLKAVFYGAGSVQSFARPFLERGTVVMSAWGANAVPVAEFALAQILLSCKGYFQNTRDCNTPEGRRKARRGPGIFDDTVGVVGAGMIGRNVIRLLKPFALEVVVYDPFLPDETAAELGVEKVGLDELFGRALVVTSHVANLPSTQGLIQGSHFQKMREGATFVNTGRGATVIEDEMIEVLTARPDLTALLDVTDPEPPVPGSALYELPNVQLSAHIAGSINNEVVRLGDYCIEEFQRWERGEPLRYSVTLEMLETMA